ncbi:MAG: hypothetical protein ACLFUH_07650 [Bacteroidales bacterium]
MDKEAIDQLIEKWAQYALDEGRKADIKSAIRYALEEYSMQLSIVDVLNKFNTKVRRRVIVVSGNKTFAGEVTKIAWDVDQWIYFVDGDWYCQSEIYNL